MKHAHTNYVHKLLSILFFVSSLMISENIQAYYASWEVFERVERNDVYAINQWLRSYPYVDIRDNVGQTPFMVAVRLGHYTIAKKLLNAGANKYAVDNFGRSVRDYAYEVYSSYPSSYTVSSDASTVLTALGVGALVAGLAAYALSDNTMSVSYNGYYDSYDRYCPGCGASRYSGESLYCDYCRYR